MSRVHDALRRAEQAGLLSPVASPPPGTNSPEAPAAGSVVPPPPVIQPPIPAAPVIARSAPAKQVDPSLRDLLDHVKQIPLKPAQDAHLIDSTRPHEAPMEEFRTLRTRMNHLQQLQPIHTVVVTSPSPAEGKSFAASNLALAQANLAGNTTLLADFDFRRPYVHTLFQFERTPGITDYLLGKARLQDVIRRIEGTNLYVMPAGEAVINPLELLNLPEVKTMLQKLPQLFNWVILDSPPLLFAADANLLSTMVDGTVLVVRIGTTTIDSITRAMQSLCENNVLGIVVNGARRGELYSKYTYYHSYYYSKTDERDLPEEEEE